MVIWKNHSIEEATWEREDEIREKYPDLFWFWGMENLGTNSLKKGERYINILSLKSRVIIYYELFCILNNIIGGLSELWSHLGWVW